MIIICRYKIYIFYGKCEKELEDKCHKNDIVNLTK